MNIITSGYKFVDIDAFACIFAYQELLRLKGEDGAAIITAVLNASITPKYRSMDFYAKDDNSIAQKEQRSFTIMDTSDPDQFERFVSVDRVVRVFDHHPGFEKFWKDKLGDGAIIEPIGAAATLIVREYKRCGLLEKISPMAAELLAVAILSNTLWFQAKISIDEDRSAYDELKEYFVFTEGFEQDYFSEVQAGIESDIDVSLRDDSKSVPMKDALLMIAQLEVWDATRILERFSENIRAFLADTPAKVSFLNLIEIGKYRNLIVFRDRQSLEYLRGYFPEFEYNENTMTAITPHVVLRKELLVRMYAAI